MSGGALVTRFAPSPTGLLHLGHAYSALLAWDIARSVEGRFLLRIEDIDGARCKEEFVGEIYEDLTWLGIEWDEPARIQSAHMDHYEQLLVQLEALRVLYPCFCTRREIEQEIGRAGGAPHAGETAVYPGICRGLSEAEQAEKMGTGAAYALRLDVAHAWRLVGENLTWQDRLAGEIHAAPAKLGDVVLARKDVSTSYHLSVVADDALQGVNLIVRGEDLFESTHMHRLLQALLGFQVPQYLHHPLALDDEGKRFAKRDGSVTLQALREAGWTPADVRQRVGL